MAIGRDTTFTWLGHAARRGRHARRQGGPVRPVATATRTAPDAATRSSGCDLLLVTHGHGDHMARRAVARAAAAPAVAVHPRDEPVARPAAARRRRPGHRHEQGRHRRGGTASRSRWCRRTHSGGDWNRAARSHALPRRAGRASCVELENGFRIYHAGDTQVFGDMALIRELFRPTSRSCRSAATSRWTRPAAALAVGLLGVHARPARSTGARSRSSPGRRLPSRPSWTPAASTPGSMTGSPARPSTRPATSCVAAVGMRPPRRGR